mgnify:FL=1
MSAASTAASLAVINAECLRNGESKPSAVATKASFGIYNRRFAPNRTSMDWLSLNPDNVDAYLKDRCVRATPRRGCSGRCFPASASSARRTTSAK